MYGSYEGFTSYHEERGREIPDSWDETYLNSVLLVASEYIDNSYGNSFSGYKASGYDQEREWPRLSAYINIYPYTAIASDSIPERVVSAVYEAAWREAETTGSLQKDYTPNKYKSVKVEGAVEVEYSQFNHSSETQLEIPIVNSLLSIFFDKNSGAETSSLSGKGVRL
ncbi:MAG: hypothetical protein CMC15_18730 [Flavobacteriaceae bacterium]|nr:hypothetical protein [Flavobacteriaceae bacterium]